jgi:hypothetical protein
MGLEDRECTRMGFQRDVVIMGIGSKRETSPDLDAWCAERPSTPGMIREWLTRQPSQPVVRRKPPPGPRDEYAELRKGIAKLRSEVRSLRADLAEQRNGYATVDYVNGRLRSSSTNWSIASTRYRGRKWSRSIASSIACSSK